MEKKKILMENTLVALFDIQGYSDFINTTSRDHVIAKSKKLCAMARSDGTTDFGSAKTMFWILSDTIIFAIDTSVAPLSYGSSYLFLHACSSFLFNSMTFCNLPVRGAIGAGYLYFDENSGRDDFGDSSLLVGDGLVDAARYEKKQNWLGAMFTPEAIKALEPFICNDDGKKLLDCIKMKHVCAYGDIPLKTPGKVREYHTEKGYYILPFSGDDNWRRHLPPYFKDIDNRLANSDCIYSTQQNGSG